MGICGHDVVMAMTTRDQALARVCGDVVIVVMSLYVMKIKLIIYRSMAAATHANTAPTQTA
jgi:hypothetical protein